MWLMILEAYRFISGQLYLHVYQLYQQSTLSTILICRYSFISTLWYPWPAAYGHYHSLLSAWKCKPRRHQRLSMLL